MTYSEKMEFLRSALEEVYCKSEDDECCSCFYICDATDEYVIIRDYCEDKYFKINYEINTIEATEMEDEKTEIKFNLSDKTEMINAFIEAPTKTQDVVVVTMEVNGEEKNIEEIHEMYTAINEEYNNYKTEMSEKVFSVTIDEVEYNVETLKEKFDEEVSLKNAANEELNNLNEKFATVSGDLEEAKEKIVELEAAIKEAQDEKLCGLCSAMIDDEEELDDEEKEDLKAKCAAHTFASTDEVEAEIAKMLYQKKKSARQTKSFKANIPAAHIDTIDVKKPVGIFEKLRNNL